MFFHTLAQWDRILYEEIFKHVVIDLSLEIFSNVSGDRRLEISNEIGLQKKMIIQLQNDPLFFCLPCMSYGAMSNTYK